MSVNDSDTFLLSRAGTIFRVGFEDIRAALPQPVWGRVSADGTALGISGASVSRVQTGRYQVTLSTPRAEAAYPILLTLEQNSGRDDYVLAYRDVTDAGFMLDVTEQDNGGTAGAYRDAGFSFFIPASNPD